jgi:hypothetical protein
MVQGVAITQDIGFLVQARDTFQQSIPLAGNVNLRIFYLSLKLTPGSFVVQQGVQPSGVTSVTSYTPDQADSTYETTDTTNFGGCVEVNLAAPSATGNYSLSIIGTVTGSIIVDEFPSQPPGVSIPNWPSAGDTLSFQEFDALIDAITGNPLLGAFAGFLPSFDVNRLPPGNNASALTVAASLAEDLAVQYAFRVAPNPATANSNVRFTLNTPEAVEIHLLDATGRLVRTVATGTLVGEQQFNLCTDCSHLASGLYTVQATIGGRTFAQRVVLQ